MRERISVTMIEIVNTCSAETVLKVRTHLDAMRDLLVADVSNYAQGRQRFWLQHEGPLSDRFNFEPAVQNARLWAWCQRIFPGAELGLAAFGPVGIGLHRDTSYADYEAVSVNLGEVGAWLYDDQYPGMAWVPDAQRNPSNVRDMELKVGDITVFNCKNPHAVIEPAEDRWSINLWRVSKKTRPKWDAYLRSQRG
jgi:hypothetical protein